MEPRSGVKIVVGLFVFTGLLLFAASIFLLGEGGRYFARQHRLHAFFTNVAGLHEGATVRLAGVAVGRVTRIRLPHPPEPKVLVELSVADEAIESVRRDSVARLVTMGVLGDKFLEVTVGDSREPRLSDGATLGVDESADFGALVGQGQRVLGAVERLAAALERGEGALPWLMNDRRSAGLAAETLDAIRTAAAAVGRLGASVESGQGALPWLLDDPHSKQLVVEALGSVRTSAASAERVAAALERGEGALPWLINDPHSKRLVAETLDALRTVAVSVERGEGALPWLIRDPASRRLVEDLGRAAADLSALTSEVRNGRGLAHALIYDPDGGELLATASRTVQEAHALLLAIREGDGVLPALLFDPESKQLLEKLTGAARHLEDISARVARGEGTLGALLSDPTIYEDLTALLEGAQRSWILRWGIRRTLESGRDARNGRVDAGAGGR